MTLVHKVKAQILPGLPPYGEMATPVPLEWGRCGSEGTVVEIDDCRTKWVVNIQPGLYGLNEAMTHPNGEDAIVLSEGDLWVLSPSTRSADLVLKSVEWLCEVTAPNGWVLCCQGLALARFGADGIVWHTRRISWDGMREFSLSEHELAGKAWSPLDDCWHSFRVDMRTGRSYGGSYPALDDEGWEQLALS